MVWKMRAITATRINHEAAMGFGSDMTYIKAAIKKAGTFSRSFKCARLTLSTFSSFLISKLVPPRTSSGFSTALNEA